MANNVYILSACDEWSGFDSMRIQGVTTDETMLHAMLAMKIKAGEMEYDGKGEEAWTHFQEDCENKEIDFNKLKYGFVQTYEDMQISEPISLSEFEGIDKAYEDITGEKAKHEINMLGLETHSLIFSVVEVRSDHDYMEAYLPGICDRDGLEVSEEYRDFVEDLDESDINVGVRSYSVGNGESEYADEKQLHIIKKYMDELDKEYGVDEILSDFFSFYYEAEQEY